MAMAHEACEVMNHLPQDSNLGPQQRAANRGRFADFLSTVRFLFPIESPETRLGRPATERLVPYVVPVGLLVGLLWVAVFRLSWWLYGETGSIRVIPSLMVVLVECLLTGPFLALGLARTVHVLTSDRPELATDDRLAPLSAVGTLVLCLTILCEYALILSIPHREGWWPSPDDWRSDFNFLYPRPIYRPLLLAPLWGRWGMLLAATIGQTARNADQTTIALNHAMTPGRLLRHAFLPVVLTAIYCSRSRNYLTGVLIGILVFAVTYIVTVAIARRARGQSRQSLFAAAQIAQLAFLAIYRACWRLIDA